MVVREDSLTLFGFLDEDEKTIFELVQTASGVGPKLAQAMLAVLAPDDLRTAVAAEDVKTLTRVPGIGQKGAQRIILELKDRIGAPVGRRPAGRRARGAGAVARPGAAGPGRPRLVGQGGRPGGRRPSPPRPASQPRRRGAAARRPPHAEPGVSMDRATCRHRPRRRLRRDRPAARFAAAEEAHLGSLTAAEAEGDERAVEAALRPRTPRRGRRPGRGSATSSAWCSRPRGSAGGRPTTCCSPARPGLGKTTLAMIIAAEMSAPRCG